MPKMSKREKQEWSVFLNPQTHRKNYNALCKKCMKGCKQSHRAKVIMCRRFVPKRGRNKTKKAAYWGEDEAP